MERHTAVRELRTFRIQEWSSGPDFYVQDGDTWKEWDGRLEYCLMQVGMADVSWKGTIKHTDGIMIETECIDIKEIAEVLK